MAGTSGCAAPSVPPPPSPAAPPGPSARVGGGTSFLPNLGLALEVGRTVSRDSTATLWLELHAAYQILDDEDFADDGHPGAGPWSQVRGGLSWSFSPGARRRPTARVGGVWARAEGEPNVVQESGDYLGVYGGVGFETALTPTLSVGPELTVLGITRDGGRTFARPVPQVNWHATVRLGPRTPAGSVAPSLPPGELYGGPSAVVSPGLGAGAELGQVFRRGASATWSVEISAALQPPREILFFEGDGRWAQVRAGVKGAHDPDSRGHWTGRAGAVWLRSTAANPFLARESDHIGAYVSAGYEYDLGERLALGPELNLMLVSWEKDVDFRLVPQLLWHLVVKP